MIGKLFYTQGERSFFPLVAAFFFLLGTGTVVAKDDPKLPPAERDTNLVEEIKKGLADTACIARLADRLKENTDALAELQKEVAKTPRPSDNAIRKLEAKLEKTRASYIDTVQECGPCRARPLEHWDSARSGYWYVSDGSCYLDTKKAALKKAVFARATQSLRAKDDYLKFPHIVKVAIVGSSQDKFDDKATLADEFHAFLAIRTPLEFLARIQTFYYYIRNTIKEGTDAAGIKTFALDFTTYLDDATSAKKPILPAKSLVQKFIGTVPGSPEKFHYMTPGGRKLLMDFNELKLVQGQWFISEDGDLRYSTFGDFYAESDAVKKHANFVLLEALMEMYNRAVAGEAL